MKVCTKCRVEKSESEFAKNSRKKSGLQDWCRVCKNNHHKTYYEANRENWLATASKLRKEVRRRLNLLKEAPCTDCKQSFDPVCMDFDHLEDKLRNVSNMVGHNSWEKILAEIEKCELVCACCHRLRTKARLSSG